MNTPEMLLMVRFRSPLPLEEVEKIMAQRAPNFVALDGLRQKYYLEITTSGEYAGLYVWDSAEALTAYRENHLAAGIAEAYQTDDEPTIEIFRVIDTIKK